MNYSHRPSPLTTVSLIVAIILFAVVPPLGIFAIVAAFIFQKRQRNGIRAHKAAAIRNTQLRIERNRLAAGRRFIS